MSSIPIDGPAAGRLWSAIDDVQAGLIESVAGVEAMIASLTAYRAELVAQAHRWAQATVDQVVPVGPAPVASGRRVELAERSFVAELGCALRISERSARQLIADSDTLVSALPVTFAGLAAGRVGYGQARVIVDETSGLDAADRHRVEETVIQAAATQTPSRLRARVRHARERLYPETVTARVSAAVANRSMSTQMGADGMAWLNLYAQAPLIAGIGDRVSQVAAVMKTNGDERTIAQLRADITATLLLGNGTDPYTNPGTASPTAGHRPSGSAMDPLAVLLSQVRAELDVSVPVLTLLGVSEMPGSLDGVVPIDADTARKLAATAPSFTRVLTHPETGVVVSVGRKRYRPPPDLARYIRLRDGTCRFPGCNRRAKHTEIDHTIQYQNGGPTRWDNLACLCKKHHHLKDETVWKVTQLEHGILQWTSPTGRVYTTEPQTELPTPNTSATGNTVADNYNDNDNDNSDTAPF
jgi:hypothetical protein